MHPYRVDYRGRGCVYRHAVDKLVGVSAGGITLSGKKTSRLFPSCLSLHVLSTSFRSEGRKTAGHAGVEAQGPMYRKHEGRNDAADKSEFAAGRVGAAFSTWMS